MIGEKKKDEMSHLPEGYSQSLVYMTLYAVFFANLFCNVDMGILPAGSTVIKEDLNINNAQFGVLGSVVYFGQTLGAALASGLLVRVNPKFLLFTCLCCNIVALLAFTWRKDFWILALSRGLTGMF